MDRNQQCISIWLMIIAFMIVAIVTLGGYTRLSGSGLSIVEWAPISGIVPPLNEEAWEAEFDKYKLFPEYQEVNQNLSIGEFKFIFMIEFLHRILGRLIGLTLILPLIYFYLKRLIPKTEFPKYLLMVLILFMQGFMGWYMVKSGLSKDPHVSHYRLSAHLIIAILLYSFVIWQIIPNTETTNSSLKKQLQVLLILVYVQIFFGGMVAGLKAGMVYNTFPLMGVSFIPYELDITNLNDAVTVQFIHRILAYITFLFSMYLGYLLYQNNQTRSAVFLFSACLLQVALGIITLVYLVPIFWALAHQLGAMLFITTILYALKGSAQIKKL
jgi:cytochrome c oxidase assembly protein subunit 15